MATVWKILATILQIRKQLKFLFPIVKSKPRFPAPKSAVTSPGVFPGWIQEVANVWQPRAPLLRNSSRVSSSCVTSRLPSAAREPEESLVFAGGELLAQITILQGFTSHYICRTGLKSPLPVKEKHFLSSDRTRNSLHR